MKDYVNTIADNGGVHINSGIPNHAFYKVAMELGGRSWERAGAIWYEAFVDPALRPPADFVTFANLTDPATSQGCTGSDEVLATRDGWAAVGVAIGP